MSLTSYNFRRLLDTADLGFADNLDLEDLPYEVVDELMIENGEIDDDENNEHDEADEFEIFDDFNQLEELDESDEPEDDYGFIQVDPFAEAQL
ncbi:hypothetical protein BGX31_009397 [Mortierella sp. GBA43]|nr:hypothetical protein BGX31_009397 [Mortierella sp. GBA43]